MCSQQDATLNMNLTKAKIVALYITLILFGLVLSLNIYYQGLDVDEEHRTLLSTKVPQLEAISNLHQEFIEQERIIYEYYATEDSSTLRKNISINDIRIAQNLEQLTHQDLPDQLLQQIKEMHQLRQKLTQQMQATLTGGASGRWDKARLILEQITLLGLQLNPMLTQLSDTIKTQLQDSQQRSSNKLSSMTLWVGSFSIVIVLIAIVSGWQITNRLKEAKEKKRLALFVERNPNPVAGFSWSGKMDYKNPAWSNRQNTIDSGLLPLEVSDQIKKIKQSNLTRLSWQHDTEDYNYLATLHKQQDLRIFTLYLEDITQKRRAEKELEFLAYHDPLSELSNRKKLQIDTLNSLSNFPKQGLALVLIGVDRFSQVTASLGFKIGDQIILSVRDRVLSQIEAYKNDDVYIQLYRFTGAKFILFIRCTEKLNIRQVTHELLLAIKKSMLSFISNKHGHFYLNLNMGIAYYPEHSTHFGSLLQFTDAAYAEVRRQGGNKILEYTHDMMERERQWLTLELDLRTAIEREQFHLVYQPKVSAHSQQLTGLECLIRWQHPEKGLVSPAEFIPVAEQSGLIIELGRWILKSSCTQTKQWLEQGFKDLVCAVNISPLQFLHHKFLDDLQSTLEITQLPAENLELEITEGVLMKDIERSTLILEKLHKMGISISIDDFGTGYSSLSYLKSFSLDKLKIDKSFVDNISVNEEDDAIIRTIIDLAQNLKLKVVAEGVETEKQAERLREYGCDEIQGYFYSKPLNVTDAFEYIKAHY